MGLWLTVGKLALKVGVPRLAKYARERLTKKERNAAIDNGRLEDDQHFLACRRQVEREARERAAAKR